MSDADAEGVCDASSEDPLPDEPVDEPSESNNPDESESPEPVSLPTPVSTSAAWELLVSPLSSPQVDQ
ncbi:hypothetical protein SALBM311S_06800 [Streptomyces alboniger]